MSSWNIAYKSLLAGIAIGLGGTAYLSIDNHVVGALVFSLGLLVICFWKLHLFTGKLCFISKPSDLVYLIFVYLHNLVGVSLVALCVMLSKPELKVVAKSLCDTKLQEDWRVIFLGILCNVLIFFAVATFTLADPGTYLILVLCIMAFILCGFEHCIANMFYLIVGGSFNIKYLALNTLGNFIGGFGACRLLMGGFKNDKE